jgi:spermidine synthase
MVAEILADGADGRADAYIEALRPRQPAAADALLALKNFRAEQLTGAAEHLAVAFRAARLDPWTPQPVFGRALNLAWQLAKKDHVLATALFAALQEPFAVRAADIKRINTRAAMGMLPGFEPQCVAALAELEPHTLWERWFLEGRAQCYQRTGHPLAGQARADLARFDRGPTLSEELLLTANELVRR